MTIADDLRGDFRREHAYTEKLLAAVPEDKLGWKPHDKSWDLATLAGHLAECPTWLSSMLEDGMDFADMGDYRPFVPESKAQLIETYAENAKLVETHLKGVSDDHLRGTWTMKKGEQVLLQQPRAEVIRDILMLHQAHHRGQLTVYLRLLDVPVPGTYGGSADEPMF